MDQVDSVVSGLLQKSLVLMLYEQAFAGIDKTSPWLQFSLLGDAWVPLLSVLLPDSAAETDPIAVLLTEFMPLMLWRDTVLCSKKLTWAVASYLPLAQDLECDSAMLLPKSLLSSHLLCSWHKLRRHMTSQYLECYSVSDWEMGGGSLLIRRQHPQQQGNVGPYAFELLMASWRPRVQHVECCN